MKLDRRAKLEEPKSLVQATRNRPRNSRWEADDANGWSSVDDASSRMDDAEPEVSVGQAETPARADGAEDTTLPRRRSNGARVVGTGASGRTCPRHPLLPGTNVPDAGSLPGLAARSHQRSRSAHPCMYRRKSRQHHCHGAQLRN
eukprot:1349962-Pleurochrysis_carterae.AAC.1